MLETKIYQLEYLTMNREIYQDPNLSDIQRRVCAFIYNYTGERFYFRNNQLAEMFNCSEWSISTAIKKLEELQYVSVRYTIRKGGGKVRYVKRLKSMSKSQEYGIISDFGKTPSQTLGKPNLYTKDNKIKDNIYADKEKNGGASQDGVVEKIWNYYLSRSKTKERLFPKRKQKIVTRLKTFTPHEICVAIDNCFNSPFHTGNNNRGWKATAKYVFRSDEVIDDLLNLKVVDTRTPERKIVDKLLYGK